MAGQDLYATYCASCHGPKGKGDGAAAITARALPSDLTVLASRRGGVYPADFVRTIVTSQFRRLANAHGPAEMPVWGLVFHAADPHDAKVQTRVDNLVAYVGTLQQK
jgi:mono/diheme cytochrome c family protein